LTNKIELDLDRNRIKTILKEAYSVSKDVLQTDFDVSCEDFISKINPYLDSNRVSMVVSLRLPSRNYPELIIEVNIRRKKMIARMGNDKLRIELNRFLTKL